MSNPKIYQVKIVNSSNPDQVELKSVVADDEIEALTAYGIPEGWKGLEAQELYHAPLNVLDIMPEPSSLFVQVRSAIGWVELPVDSLLRTFDQGLNYTDQGVCHEGGAMQHVRFVFTDQQIAQLKDYF